MSRTEQVDAPTLLAAMRAGDTQAGEQLFPLLYDELRRAAGRLLASERDGHTLNPTDLVHEVWLRLGAGANGMAAIAVEDRAHFLGLTTRAMRQVLIDHARRRAAGKRGGDAVRVTLDERDGARLTSPEELIVLFDALEKLGEVDERLRRVVECRYLSGLTDEETATLLQVTTRTVQRDWIKARAWLYQRLYAAETGA